MYQRNLWMAAPVMAVLMCGTAHAALTADQVWTDLQTAATEAGVKIAAATELREDGELILNGVSVTRGRDGVKIIDISELTLVPQDDGSVAFFPGDISLHDTGPAAVLVTHEELSVSVHEDAAGLGYAIDADALTVDVKIDESADGATHKFDGVFELTGLGGRYTRGGEKLGLELGAEKVVYTITQQDSAAGLDSHQVSDTEALQITGEVSLPAGGLDLTTLTSPAAVVAAARSGLGLSLAATQGKSSGKMEERSVLFPLSATFSALPAVTSLVLNAETFAFSTEAEGMEFVLQPPTVPAPATLTSGVFAFGMTSPVVAVEEPGDYGLRLKIADLVLDDAAWGLIDPEAQLDHGPAQLDLDLGGKLKVDLIALSEASGAEPGAQVAPPPMPEPLSLDIRTLLLQVAGGSLTGTGSFTFDNSAAAFGGPPMPVGTADLRLEGGNGLLDTLVAMGWLTEEDAGGARMMLMMFGAAVEGEDDVVTSKIEAKEGGEIHVNGQRIQ